jgi:hypothetical protein
MEAAVAAVRGPTAGAAAPFAGPPQREAAGENRRAASSFGDEDFTDEGSHDEDLGDEDFGDEGFGEEDLGNHAAPAPPPARATAPVGDDRPADGFSYELDELGLDPEAAFRPRRSLGAKRSSTW